MEFYLSRNRFIFVAILLMIIWAGLFFVIIKYGHALQTDPCSECSKRLGDKVICTVQGNPLEPLQQRTFYPNFSVGVST